MDSSQPVIRDSSIIVWDRQLDGIKEAGYRAEGYQLLSIEPRTGYDEKAAFSGPLMGTLIWGDLKYIPRYGENPLETDTENTSNVSHFATDPQQPRHENHQRAGDERQRARPGSPAAFTT